MNTYMVSVMELTSSHLYPCLGVDNNGSLFFINFPKALFRAVISFVLKLLGIFNILVKQFIVNTSYFLGQFDFHESFLPCKAS